MAQTFTMDDLRQRLQARQHKMTPQRQTVLQVFLDHPGEHLSAEDVHGILRQGKSEIGLATVYRRLELLSEFESNASSLLMSHRDHHHHHLICTTCGAVTEFEDDLLDDLEADIQKKMGFHVLNHQVKFYGTCKECQSKN